VEVPASGFIVPNVFLYSWGFLYPYKPDRELFFVVFLFVIASKTDKGGNGAVKNSQRGNEVGFIGHKTIEI
jgi:hypothetical protein